MLILALIPSLLLLLTPSLTATTPRTPNQNPPTLANARAVDCTAQYGTSIDPGDCTAVITQMRHYIDFTDQPTERYVGPFGRRPADVRYLVPLIFRTPSCTIALDLTRSRDGQMAFWSTNVDAAQYLVDRCVRTQRIGGELETMNGWMLMVIIERSLDPRLKELWDGCLGIGLKIDIGACWTFFTSPAAPKFRGKTWTR